MDRLNAPKPFLFPPMSLLMEVLVFLQIHASVELFFVKIRKRFTVEQWLKHVQRLFPTAQQEPLLEFLHEHFNQERCCWSIEENVPAAIIELRKDN
jgi:hypothetical protein